MIPVATRKRARHVAARLLTAALTLTLGSAVAATLPAGCASAPPERLYTLSAAAPARAAGEDVPAEGPTVVVAPAAVPDLVDRPQLVTFVDGHRVVILEQQRWAEPLRAGISRVVADGLGRQLGTTRVSTRDEALQRPDCRVYLDVRRLDVRRGGVVDLDALWTVACADGVTRTGRSVAREPIRGDTTDAMVVAQGRALQAIARDVGHALRDTTPLTTAATRGDR
jgi:uncharacterized lipoprotein YmbA